MHALLSNSLQPGSVSTVWEGIGSSIVSGVIGGLVVFGSIWLAQRLHDKSETRRVRRESANQVLAQVMHLSDKVLNTSARYRGAFSLWPLREQLLLNWHALSGTAAYDATEGLLSACDTYRTWARADGGGADGSDESTRTDYDIEHDADAYLRVLRQHADAVVALLRGPLHSSSATGPAFQYPQLPWFMNPDDIPYEEDA
jgi:hypothetical protein